MAVGIGRREVIAGLGSAALTSPLVAQAQQPSMPVIGILSTHIAAGSVKAGDKSEADRVCPYAENEVAPKRPIGMLVVAAFAASAAAVPPAATRIAT